MPRKRIHASYSRPDWSKAAITFAVHSRGLTFKGLALANGYRSVDAISQCLHRPYPKAERILAEAIGERPEVIWPSRYLVSDKTKINTAAPAENVKIKAAA